MNVTIERDAFLAAMQRVIGSVDRKGTVLALQHVIINATSGRMTLTATNRDMQATTSFPCRTGEDAVFTLPGQTVLDALNNLPPGGEVNLATTEGDPRITVKCGKSRFKMPTIDPADIPLITPPDAPPTRLAADDLGAILSAAAYALGKDTAGNFLMTGAYVISEPDTLRVIGADGLRMGIGAREARGHTGSAIIPAPLLSEMIKLAAGADLAELILTDRQAQLTVADTVLVGKVIEGEFVNYSRILAFDRPHALVVDHELLTMAIRRSLIMANDKNRAIRLTMHADTMEVEARNNASGEARSELEAEWDGPDAMTVSFNGSYLSDALARMTKESVTILFGDKAVPVLMQEEGVMALVGTQRG